MLRDYWNDHWKHLLLLAACAGIFALIFWLEGVPLRAAGYGFLLCGALLLAAGFLGALRFNRKVKTLKRLGEKPLAELSELPEASSGLERRWAALVKNEYRARVNLLEEAEGERRQAMDYYTLWVHQIKTPIAALRLILSQDTDHDRAAMAEVFAIEQYAKMVLSYLRLSGDSTDFVFRSCDLDKLVRGQVRYFAPLFIRKKLSLAYTPSDCEVLTDEKWLSFVIGQLLSNAVKYTKEGGVRIYLEEPKTLVIEDTGIGIAPEDIPRIGERGFTGLNGRADRSATGLGLYLCRQICEKLSHGLSIESEPEKGTRVRLDLSRKAGIYE